MNSGTFFIQQWVVMDPGIISFGKYKGMRLVDAPDSWFLWMLSRGLLTKEMKEAARRTRPALFENVSHPQKMMIERKHNNEKARSRK